MHESTLFDPAASGLSWFFALCSVLRVVLASFFFYRGVPFSVEQVPVCVLGWLLAFAFVNIIHVLVFF
jgi:hypothetical protein